MAGGHRRVRREDDFARNARHGLVEAQAFLLHALANRLEHGKAAVSFVQVQNAGRDPHRLQRAKTADAEQQFLADPRCAPSPPYKSRRQFAILRSISFDVGIQQQQIAAADLHAPDFRADRAGACLDLHRHGLAVDSDGGFHRQLVDVRLQIFFLLPAVAIEALAEISLAVKQADADQRNIRDPRRS